MHNKLIEFHEILTISSADDMTNGFVTGTKTRKIWKTHIYEFVY